MEKYVESRKIVCKYPLEKAITDEYHKFGWNPTKKTLLNRFGNPLPIGERVSQSDLEEKCSYEIIFTRETDYETASKLDKLQEQYHQIEIKPTHFGGRRVTGMVFISIGRLFMFALSIGFFPTSLNETFPAYISTTIFFLLLSLGLHILIVTGIFQCINNGKKNEEKIRQQNDLEKSAKKLLGLLKTNNS